MDATEILQKRNGIQIHFSINIELPDLDPSAVGTAKSRRKKKALEQMDDSPRNQDVPMFRSSIIPMAG